MTPEQIAEVNARAVESLQITMDAHFGRGGWPTGFVLQENAHAPRMGHWKFHGGPRGAWSDLDTGANGDDLVALTCHFIGTTDRAHAARWLDEQLRREVRPSPHDEPNTVSFRPAQPTRIGRVPRRDSAA